MNVAKITRTAHSAEFKAGVVLAGFARNTSIEELCRQRGISVSLYYEWRKRFIRSGTAGLERRSRKRQTREATSTRVDAERAAARDLVAVFQKFSSDQAQIAGCMNVPEKLKAIELVGSAGVSKRLALGRIGVASSTYYNWCRMLREKGNLDACVRLPEYCKLTEREDLRERVFKVLHSPPSDFGFNRTTWRLIDLQAAVEQSSGLRIGRHAIRSIIKDAGYRWMKARKVLTRLWTHNQNNTDAARAMADRKITGHLS